MDKNPQHIAIIMDGNRRWAKKNNLGTEKGHEAGAQTLENIVKEIKRLGIKYLTVFALSTENLSSRSRLELTFLFALMEKVIKEKVAVFAQNSIGMKIIGDVSAVPEYLQKSLQEAVEKLESYQDTILVVAVNYGSRAEIVNAVNKIEDKTKISEKDIDENLYTADIPDPDLVIRTGGQKRLSNFLLWQASYSELFFTDTLWPDFSEKELQEILLEFENRKRNFGK